MVWRPMRSGEPPANSIVPHKAQAPWGLPRPLRHFACACQTHLDELHPSGRLASNLGTSSPRYEGNSRLWLLFLRALVSVPASRSGPLYLTSRFASDWPSMGSRPSLPFFYPPRRSGTGVFLGGRPPFGPACLAPATCRQANSQYIIRGPREQSIVFLR